MGDRCSCLHDKFKCQDDQAKPDAYPAQLAGPCLLARKEENHAKEDQQRRQPGQVEGQHPGHQRGTHVGTQHDRQGRGHGHQALADEGGDQHGRGVTALNHGSDQNTGDECQRALVHVLADDAPQVRAEYPKDAGTHNVGTPDQKRHGREQVEQGQHGEGPLLQRPIGPRKET